MNPLVEQWNIRDVQIPSRIVLAPMAGVSVQAFRRQGRRFGAGLVCSEMVSACGLSYGNERTLGYLRIARDEHPLAVQIFGSEPDRMAEAAQMVVAAGADIVDINFGCPVRKVTKTGSGASALEDHDLAVASRAPWSMRSTFRSPSRCAAGCATGRAPRSSWARSSRRAGVAALTLHPRSAQQMYTGTADHTLTAELVERVGVPVIASGDITDRARAQVVLDSTGAAAVMIGRGAQGRPWALREMAGGTTAEPDRAEVYAELIRFMREVVREMGDERSVGFLRKFYGWYLRGSDGARAVRGELMTATTVAEAEDVLLRACPAAGTLLAQHEAELGALPDTDTDRLLDLPISIYGGG